MTEVSDFPDFASSAWLEMYQGMEILGDPLWHLYLGNIDGTPVGTSKLFLGSRALIMIWYSVDWHV